MNYTEKKITFNRNIRNKNNDLLYHETGSKNYTPAFFFYL